MQVSVARDGAISIITLAGSLDASTADAVAGRIAQQVREGNTRLVADLSELDYLSSAGLRVLLSALKDTRAQGGDLRLAAVQADVCEVLEMTGFTNFVQLYPTVSAAVGSFAA